MSDLSGSLSRSGSVPVERLMIMLSPLPRLGLLSSFVGEVSVADVLSITEQAQHDHIGCEIYEHITYLSIGW